VDAAIVASPPLDLESTAAASTLLRTRVDLLCLKPDVCLKPDEVDVEERT
jgi:hypothetical protein